MGSVELFGSPSGGGGETPMRFHPLVEPLTIALFAVVVLAVFAWGLWRALKATSGRRIHVFVTWGRRILIGAVLAFAMAGPSVPAEEIEVASNIEIIFAVDRTGSMAAEDGPDGTTRLDSVRSDIIEILGATAGSRYAVLTWDADARVELPFTTDASAVQSFAELLHQEISEFSSGSTHHRPVAELVELLSNAQEQRPENIRYLLVFTDGEVTQSIDASGQSPEWSEVSPYIDGGAVLGYGTEEGAPMRTYQPGGEGAGDYMVDPASPQNPKNEDGDPLAISRIDLDALEELANELGIELLVNPTPEASSALGTAIMDSAQFVEDARGLRHTFRYIVWLPALVAGLLLIWELGADAYEFGRLRRTGAF